MLSASTNWFHWIKMIDGACGEQNKMLTRKLRCFKPESAFTSVVEKLYTEGAVLAKLRLVRFTKCCSLKKPTQYVELGKDDEFVFLSSCVYVLDTVIETIKTDVSIRHWWYGYIQRLQWCWTNHLPELSLSNQEHWGAQLMKQGHLKNPHRLAQFNDMGITNS